MISPSSLVVQDSSGNDIAVSASNPLPVQQTAGVSGGIPSTSRLLSAAGTSGDATLVKSTAGKLYGIQGANVRASAVYLKLYNSGTIPTAGSGTPVKTIYLPPSSAFAFDWAAGLSFTAGIGYTLTTAGADASSASVTAGDIVALNVDYA